MAGSGSGSVVHDADIIPEIAEYFIVVSSSLLGVFSFMYKISDIFSEVFCGNKGYEGDIGALDEFLMWESEQRSISPAGHTCCTICYSSSACDWIDGLSKMN